MKYAGADWLKKEGYQKLSPFGRVVADIVGQVWRGIYHINYKTLIHERCNWNSNICIELVVRDDLATTDCCELTDLVIMCHDRHIRLSIKAAFKGYLRLLFHPRVPRGERPDNIIDHPTIEQAIERVRRDLAFESEVPNDPA